MAAPLLEALEKLSPEQLATEFARANEYLASDEGQNEFRDMFKSKAGCAESKVVTDAHMADMRLRLASLGCEMELVRKRLDALEAAR